MKRGCRIKDAIAGQIYNIMDVEYAGDMRHLHNRIYYIIESDTIYFLEKMAEFGIYKLISSTAQSQKKSKQKVDVIESRSKAARISDEFKMIVDDFLHKHNMYIGMPIYVWHGDSGLITKYKAYLTGIDIQTGKIIASRMMGSMVSTNYYSYWSERID